MKLLHIVPGATAFKFVDKRKMAFIISGGAMLASIAIFVTAGLNFGIDFRGGTMMVISTEVPVDHDKIRALVKQQNLGDVQVQEFGSDTEVMIRVEQQSSARNGSPRPWLISQRRKRKRRRRRSTSNEHPQWSASTP